MPLFKKLLIYCLDVQSFHDAAPDAVSDHQACKLIPID